MYEAGGVPVGWTETPGRNRAGGGQGASPAHRCTLRACRGRPGSAGAPGAQRRVPCNALTCLSPAPRGVPQSVFLGGSPPGLGVECDTCDGRASTSFTFSLPWIRFDRFEPVSTGPGGGAGPHAPVGATRKRWPRTGGDHTAASGPRIRMPRDAAWSSGCLAGTRRPAPGGMRRSPRGRKVADMATRAGLVTCLTVATASRQVVWPGPPRVLAPLPCRADNGHYVK